MIPNKRPTMLTDCASFGTDDESLNRLYEIRELPKYVVPADFARTLERSLAERTEERDTCNTAYRLAKENQELLIAQLDTALAKLAKCKQASSWTLSQKLF